MRPRLILPLFAVVLALLAIIPGVPPFWITLLNNIGLAALVAIGLVLLTGVGGMTSFGQAAFCGFGAYTTAILTTTYGLSPWLSLPVALAVTGVAAVLLGLITVRLSGHYLPLGTLAWGISLYFLFGKIDLLGRHDGISGIPPLSIGPWSLIDPKATYWVIWTFVLLAGIGTSNLLSSRIGRAIRALRRGGVAAESFGVERMRVKLVVFVYAALLAGLSGWLYAHLQRSVNPTPFGLGAGIEYLLMATIGGAGHVWGGLLGAGPGGLRRVEARDGEHAVARQHVAEHVAVARLEDMQGQQGLRKENGVGEGHHRHGLGQRRRRRHGERRGDAAHHAPRPVQCHHPAVQGDGGLRPREHLRRPVPDDRALSEREDHADSHRLRRRLQRCRAPARRLRVRGGLRRA